MDTLDNIILSAALSFLITFFAIPVIIQVAKKKKLFDEPDERKVHKEVIPTLGGLGIFAGFIMAVLMGVPYTQLYNGAETQLQYFAAATVVIFFLGIKDDILVLSATKKFIGQLIAAGILIKFGNIRIENLHGFLGIEQLPYVASVVFTMFTIIVITNSFNLIDGVDGLAGSLGLLTTIVFGAYFIYAGNTMFAVISLSLSGSILGFLIYNFSPAKIFMGDTGSLLIGLVNATLVIKFINMAAIKNTPYALEAAPAIGFAILMIPLFDTLRVFSLRILDRRSPFSPDRNHIHHFLLDLGMNHRQITFTIVTANILFIALAYFIRNLGTAFSLCILLSTALVSIGAVFYYSRKKTKSKSLVSHKGLNGSDLMTRRSEILTLASEALESD